MGLGLLLARPPLDVWWKNEPAHFWLVLAAGGLNAALAYGTGVAARRRRDARVFLVSLMFLAAAGFLGLHALATPGVLLDRPNAGFALATPVGLVVAAFFAVASSLDLAGGRGGRVMRHASLLQNGLVAVLIVWGVVSLAALGPLEGVPAPEEPAGWPPSSQGGMEEAAPERASGVLLAGAGVGVALYALAVARYGPLERPFPFRNATGAVAAQHPDWPHFRVGLNTGEALVGMLDTGGGRTYTAVGDAVNLTARLEGEAPVGGVALGPATVAQLPDARTESLGAITVKGKDAPVEAHRLLEVGERGVAAVSAQGEGAVAAPRRAAARRGRAGSCRELSTRRARRNR